MLNLINFFNLYGCASTLNGESLLVANAHKGCIKRSFRVPTPIPICSNRYVLLQLQSRTKMLILGV